MCGYNTCVTCEEHYTHYDLWVIWKGYYDGEFVMQSGSITKIRIYIYETDIWAIVDTQIKSVLNVSVSVRDQNIVFIVIHIFVYYQ